MSDITMTREGDAAILRINGDIVAATLGQLRPAFKQVIDEGASALVVDLAETREVDSMGVGLLIAAYNSLSAVGGMLSLIHVSEDLRELFAMMRLDQRFRISSVDEE